MNKQLIIILICISAFLVMSTKNLLAADFLSNSDYILYKNGNNLEVVDINTHSSYDYDIGFDYELVEIANSYPFVSIENKEEESYFIRYYIFDIEKKNLYNIRGTLGPAESRWSSSGEFTYINMGYSYIIIPTLKLRAYLKSNTQEDVINISGHPLFPIGPGIWLGDQLIYSSAIGETADCWGALDSKSRKNYFIDCCGYPYNPTYSKNCLSEQRDIIIREYIQDIRKMKTREVGYDFYAETLKILESK